MKKYTLPSLAIVAILLASIYLYFSIVDQRETQLISEANNMESDKQKVIVEDNQVSTSNIKPQVAKTASLNGKCVKGVSGISESLLSKIKIGDDYYPYSPTFSCVLSDGTYVIGGQGEFWSHDSKVIHFDESGTLLNTFAKDNGSVSGGEFEVSDVASGTFSISHRVIDPCYDATFTFTFDLNTGKYTEDMKGGDDAKCWDELNARGGV